MHGDPGNVLNRLEEKLADVLFVLPDRPAKDQLIVAGRGKKLSHNHFLRCIPVYSKDNCLSSTNIGSILLGKIQVFKSFLGFLDF